VPREREDILIATLPTSSPPNAGEQASKTSVISEITEHVRPEFEILTQRTANLVASEIKSRKNAAPGKIWPAELLKTGVFWQALIRQMASQYPICFGTYKNEVISHALCHPDRRQIRPRP